ncbi:c-Myc-binding protein homolog [Drosophila sechellia]|uniref:GM24030 n=1 Tax=Drosophila sechellia TaxID=7238 RepID=B4HGY3_DROSE|nr:c-Myc-binding protein homolog [Drosophila sechellia]EDW42454.1 GM24030 [Drosophila sechellia]
MSFKPIDPKRDEIRRYLERGSVLDSLTKLFIRVIKERPENPMDYIRNHIGVVRHQHDKYERLQQDLQLANEEIQRLRAIINSINPDVLQGHQSVASSEVVVATEAPQTMAEPTEAVEQQQQENGEIGPEKPDESSADVAEITAAVEACQIEGSAVVSSEEAAQPSPTVQAEATGSSE